MTYFPVVLASDNRWRKALAPLRLQNWFVEPQSEGANKPARAVLVPTPGRVSRLDLGAPIRGLYAENGVRSGLLHAVAGDKLYSISSAWTPTEIGTIGGTGEAVFDGLRDALYVARGAKPWRWNGALTQVADTDAPDVASMVVLAQRIVAIELNSDTLFWSATLDGTAWEALGFATAEQRPDIARAVVRVSGQLVIGGAHTIEIHRSTGNSTLPFANVTGQSIEESDGFLSARSWARSGDKILFIGGNLAPYVVSGFALGKLPPNGELEDELQALSEADRALVDCWSYRRGSHEFFVVRVPAKPAFVLDIATGQWARRASWEEDIYLPKYYARAYGKDVVADESGSVLYTLEESAHDDAGVPIERIATLRLGLAQPESIGSMCLDLQAYDRPLTGQGSAPVLMIDISGDGRTQRDDSRSEVTVDIGADGRFEKPVLWGLGDFSPGEGATITLRLTDPIGLSLAGAWMNEGAR
jgi:hypothetical protein